MGIKSKAYFLLFLFFPLYALSESKWELFDDKGRAFSALLADPREAQLKVGGTQDLSRSNRYMDLGVGGDLGLAHKELSKLQFLSVTPRLLMTSRFEFFSESFDLINIDYIGGLAFGAHFEKAEFESFIFHQSSHLSDSPKRPKYRNFSFEGLRIMYAYNVIESLKLYSGVAHIFRGKPKVLKGKFEIISGFEYRPFLKSYLALDLRLRQVAKWKPNMTLQVGRELGDEKKILKKQRLFLEYFKGRSNMGQFFESKETYLMVGVSYTI